MHVGLRLEGEMGDTEHDLWVVRTEDTVELEVDGEQLEARVERQEDGPLLVHLGDQVLEVSFLDDRTARIGGHTLPFELTAFEPGGAPGAHDTLVQGQGVVRPPMPGKITTLDVQEGDQVEQGDRLAVLEAMKMQSAIEAPREGTVLRVHITEGQAVDAKDVLIEIGDPEALEEV